MKVRNFNASHSQQKVLELWQLGTGLAYRGKKFLLEGSSLGLGCLCHQQHSYLQA